MAFDRYNEILQLSKALMGKKNPSGKFSFGDKEVSYSALNDTLREELQALAGTPALFRENKNILFRLIEETLSTVMPQNVIDSYGMFADIMKVDQGNTVTFRRKIGRQRAKQFITRVGLAGRYEVFELADETFTIQTTAYGGAARIGLEEFLDGRVQWADYLDIVNEGMAEAVYKEIAKALVSSINKFPATNKVSGAAFDEAQFDRLIATVSAYGAPVIYCTREAAVTLVPSNQWVSEGMKDERWATGYFTKYKGTPVVVLPQSFTDETNSTKVIDPALIYIIPTNAGEKPVKIVYEGNTLVKEFENRDWSTEIQVYQKFGVAVMATNNMAVFKNTTLTKTNTPGSWS